MTPQQESDFEGMKKAFYNIQQSASAASGRLDSLEKAVQGALKQVLETSKTLIILTEFKKDIVSRLDKTVIALQKLQSEQSDLKVKFDSLSHKDTPESKPFWKLFKGK